MYCTRPHKMHRSKCNVSITRDETSSWIFFKQTCDRSSGRSVSRRDNCAQWFLQDRMRMRKMTLKHEYQELYEVMHIPNHQWGCAEGGSRIVDQVKWLKKCQDEICDSVILGKWYCSWSTRHPIVGYEGMTSMIVSSSHWKTSRDKSSGSMTSPFTCLHGHINCCPVERQIQE